MSQDTNGTRRGGSAAALLLTILLTAIATRAVDMLLTNRRLAELEAGIRDLSQAVSTMSGTLRAFGITPEELERLMRERRAGVGP